MGISIRFVSVCLAVFLLASCGHLTPVVNEPEQASFDGNEQNSGIVKPIYDVSPDGDIRLIGYEISCGAKERFDALVERYGASLIPSVSKHSIPSLPNGNYLMGLEDLESWRKIILIMNRPK